MTTCHRLLSQAEELTRDRLETRRGLIRVLEHDIARAGSSLDTAVAAECQLRLARWREEEQQLAAALAAFNSTLPAVPECYPMRPEDRRR